MNHATETARRYLDSWNAADATERCRLLAHLWADDGRYADPMMSASGIGAIDGMIAAVQQKFGRWPMRKGSRSRAAPMSRRSPTTAACSR